MTIKYYTLQSPPPVLAEPKSELPDECRQSDFVPLPALLERFIATGSQFSQYLGAFSLSEDEKNAMFEQTDVADLEDMDLVDQKAFIDSVNNSLQSKTVEKEPTQPVKQDEPEKKPETAENA